MTKYNNNNNNNNNSKEQQTAAILNTAYISFILEPCIDKNFITSNQHMHIFTKNTLKSCKIQFTPTCFGSYKNHPQGAIIRSLLKYLQVHGASPYSRYCGCIGELVFNICGSEHHAL